MAKIITITSTTSMPSAVPVSEAADLIGDGDGNDVGSLTPPSPFKGEVVGNSRGSIASDGRRVGPRDGGWDGYNVGFGVGSVEGLDVGS